MLIKPKKRGRDGMGSGAFGASRGRRRHNGEDFRCDPGAEIYSGVAGIVTKIGYPYSQNDSTPKNTLKSCLRYVQVTDVNGLNHRYFYVKPNANISVDVVVSRGTLLGTCSDLNAIWGIRMKNHIHYEVKDGSMYLDPNDFV